MKKIDKILIKTAAVLDIFLTAVFAFIAPLLLFSAWWMFRTWKNLTMDELVFHLTGPLEGTNSDIIREYLLQCALPALLILALCIIGMIIFRKKKYFYLLDGALLLVFIGISFGTIYVTADKFDVEGYLASQGTYSEFIDDNYVDPAEVSITFPQQKRNLIYIFLESMETTYAGEDAGGGFEENVIPELTEIAQENENFSGKDTQINGAYSMYGATWTMGAMFAHTAGLPLNISIGSNDMDTQDTFFAGAVTLGDILQEQGYSQRLLIGSDATFGGRRLYFTEHGEYDIVDYQYAVENGWIPEDYYVWWGYEDAYLFEFAKEQLQDLSGQGEPFNLTMLTVDTHFEDGYVCEKCEDTYGDDQYANVMACSSKQIEEFIQWIQEQDFYENTTIVLAGDHLTMDSDFCEDVSYDYERKTYVSYINSAVEPETDTNRIYTTFDHFPTTIAALGAQIEGNRLGLGTNLFSTEETLTERYGIDYENQELEKRSELLDQLANIDEDNTELMYRKGKLPAATIVAGEYDQMTKTFPIVIRDVQNVQNGIRSIIVAAWTSEDQSDIQWVQLGENEDGSYGIWLGTEAFVNINEGIHIQGYLIDGSGESYFIGEEFAEVKE